MVKSISLGLFSSADELIAAANLTLANALGKVYDEDNKCIWVTDKLGIEYYGYKRDDTVYPICRFAVKKSNGTVVYPGYNMLNSIFSSTYPYTIYYDYGQYHIAFGLNNSGNSLNTYFSDLVAKCTDGEWYGINIVYDSTYYSHAWITDPDDASCKNSRISVNHRYGDGFPCSMFALPNPYKNTVFHDVYVVLSAPLQASYLSKTNMTLNGIEYHLFSSNISVYNTFAITT